MAAVTFSLSTVSATNLDFFAYSGQGYTTFGNILINGIDQWNISAVRIASMTVSASNSSFTGVYTLSTATQNALPKTLTIGLAQESDALPYSLTYRNSALNTLKSCQHLVAVSAYGWALSTGVLLGTMNNGTWNTLVWNTTALQTTFSTTCAFGNDQLNNCVRSGFTSSIPCSVVLASNYEVSAININNIVVTPDTGYTGVVYLSAPATLPVTITTDGTGLPTYYLYNVMVTNSAVNPVKDTFNFSIALTTNNYRLSAGVIGGGNQNLYEYTTNGGIPVTALATTLEISARAATFTIPNIAQKSTYAIPASVYLMSPQWEVTAMRINTISVSCVDSAFNSYFDIHPTSQPLTSITNIQVYELSAIFENPPCNKFADRINGNITVLMDTPSLCAGVIGGQTSSFTYYTYSFVISADTSSYKHYLCQPMQARLYELGLI